MEAELQEQIKLKVNEACTPYIGMPVNSVTLSALKLKVHAAIVHILSEHKLAATFENFDSHTGTMNFKITNFK